MVHLRSKLNAYSRLELLSNDFEMSYSCPIFLHFFLPGSNSEFSCGWTHIFTSSSKYMQCTAFDQESIGYWLNIIKWNVKVKMNRFTLYFFQVTIICSFVFPTPPRPLNIFFAICILIICGAVLVLVSIVYFFLFSKCWIIHAFAEPANHFWWTAIFIHFWTADKNVLLSTDILVSARRPGAQIPKPDLLYTVLNSFVVYMCQLVFSWCREMNEYQVCLKSCSLSEKLLNRNRLYLTWA